MQDDTTEPFGFPAIGRKKLAAAFDGGRLTSDGGVMLLAAAERRLGLADLLAAQMADHRDPARVVHSLADILRARMLAIACGHEDADDLDHPRRDPGFKLACGRLPETGRDLCSQPTMSRWENAPSLREVVRLMRAMVDLYCASYPKLPASVTLDIDDTLDVVHGRQQPSLFDAHHDERRFLPVHVTIPPPPGPWRCCRGRARPPRARRSGAICAAWCGGSGATGRGRASPCAATATTAARR